MKLYLTAKIPSYLKVNGNFIGKVNQNLKMVNANLKDALLEFLPVNTNYEPFYCDLNNSYDFLDGKLVFPAFNKKRNFDYKILTQKRYDIDGNSFLLTLLQDGTIKFYLDGTFIATDELPFIPTSFDLKIIKNYIILSFLNDITALFIYEINKGQIVLVYKDIVKEYLFNDNLTIKKTTYPLFNGELTEIWKPPHPLTLTYQNYEKFSEFNPKIIPFYFFYMIKLGFIDCDLLDDNLKAKSKDLFNFIGNINHLFPHPYNFNKVSVISNGSIKNYTLKFNQNLITNILEE